MAGFLDGPLGGPFARSVRSARHEARAHQAARRVRAARPARRMARGAWASVRGRPLVARRSAARSRRLRVRGVAGPQPRAGRHGRSRGRRRTRAARAGGRARGARTRPLLRRRGARDGARRARRAGSRTGAGLARDRDRRSGAGPGRPVARVALRALHDAAQGARAGAHRGRHAGVPARSASRCAVSPGEHCRHRRRLGAPGSRAAGRAGDRRRRGAARRDAGAARGGEGGRLPPVRRLRRAGTDPFVAGASVGGEIQLSANSASVVYRADRDTDGGLELYRVPVILSPAPSPPTTKMNGPLTAGGNVGQLTLAPDSARAVYRADEDTDTAKHLAFPTTDESIHAISPTSTASPSRSRGRRASCSARRSRAGPGSA